MRRAVQIGLVDSLTTVDTVLAVRRFSVRRGIPTVIYSDNAKKASQLIPDEMGHTTITWKFNAPLALWWGGWWERLIRSTNQDFANHLGKKSVTRKHLKT
ncbi:Gag-pol polyprotein [Elysia marginata]|uniref:Gag-pol polyprotein n=1 Tax=Elysia marginata TaxID=1093978 RepID=A0AAV4JAE5_9GAST|nr:Gag-pol polyprotein [Elysia marginata]